MTVQNHKLSIIEKTVLIIVFLLMVAGIIISLVNKTWFEQKYVEEDGFIEDITLLPLAALTLTAITILARNSRRRNLFFFLTYFFIAAGSFFVLGEEISWGQRIFNFKTTEYFKEHNTQDEMNIHNLILDGEKLNKIIFTDVLVVGVIIYLVGFPLLYKRNPGFRNFIDKAAVPIPRLYQVISCGLVFGLSFLTFNDKGAELLEFGASSIFMLILFYPLNRYARDSLKQ